MVSSGPAVNVCPGVLGAPVMSWMTSLGRGDPDVLRSDRWSGVDRKEMSTQPPLMARGKDSSKGGEVARGLLSGV